MDQPKSVWLNELTWQEVAQYLKNRKTVIVPLGSTEQHGPAGPLGLDTYVAIALAEDAAREAGCLVTPPLWFGDAVHHLAFPGTVSLKTTTLIEVIKDICTSLARHGFTRQVIVNGHKMTNLAALQAAVRWLREHDLRHAIIAIADPMYLARGIAGPIKEAPEHHAGELEISHVWHKFPHLIRAEHLTTENVDLKELVSPFALTDLFGPAGDTVDIPWNSYEQAVLAPTGSFSASAKASAEKGRQYHEYMVQNLVRLVKWLEAYSGPLGAS
jgi:creatinine amidohydrolase